MAIMVSVADLFDVGQHIIEICSIVTQEHNLNHYLSSKEYQIINDLCK
jgi:L-lactate utilization protein LutB